jgi:hypothetical protein
LSILKWAAAAERLTRLPEALEAIIVKGISRWSAKWQTALRKEVSPIPEAWSENLKAPLNQPGARPSENAHDDGAPEEDAEEEGDEAETPHHRYSSVWKPLADTEADASDEERAIMTRRTTRRTRMMRNTKRARPLQSASSARVCLKNDSEPRFSTPAVPSSKKRWQLPAL